MFYSLGNIKYDGKVDLFKVKHLHNYNNFFYYSCSWFEYCFRLHNRKLAVVESLRLYEQVLLGIPEVLGG